MALAEVTMASLSDAHLVAASREGCSEALSELFRRHHESAIWAARRVAQNETDAHDAVAEAWAKIVRVLRAGRLPDLLDFGRYLRAAAINAALDIVESRNRLTALDGRDEADGAAGPDEAWITQENAGDVARALGQLRPEWRHVLVELIVKERSLSEVALELGKTPNATAQLALRARRGLAKQLRSAGFEPAPARKRRNSNARKAAVVVAATVAATLGAAAAGALLARRLQDHPKKPSGMNGTVRTVSPALAQDALPAVPIAPATMAVDPPHVYDQVAYQRKRPARLAKSGRLRTAPVPNASPPPAPSPNSQTNPGPGSGDDGSGHGDVPSAPDLRQAVLDSAAGVEQAVVDAAADAAAAAGATCPGIGDTRGAALPLGCPGHQDTAAPKMPAPPSA